MDIFDLYKPFRNKISMLAYDDSFLVTWAYSQYLQIEKFTIPKDVEVNKEFYTKKPPQVWIAEWDLEVIAKEVILNGSPASKGGRSLRSWAVLSKTITALRDLENEIYKLRSGKESALVELIRIAHRQFIWQGNSPNSAAIMRYYRIYNDNSINEICLTRIGLTVNDIYLCGVAFMGLFLHNPAVLFPVKTDIPSMHDEKVTKFLTYCCRSIGELKKIIHSEQRYDGKFAYAYTSLRAYPFVRMLYRGKDSIVCPLPTLLFWRITGGLYYDLWQDERFAHTYGQSFQNYVGEVAARAWSGPNFHILPEQQYGPRKARKDSVDWIVCDNDAAIFLECKAKRLSWTAKAALEGPESLEKDIDVMAAAIVQVYRTIADYQDGQYPHFPCIKERPIYPVVVTLENWHAFGGTMLDMLRDKVLSKLTAAGTSREVVDAMPYSLWAMEELEVAAQIMSVVGVRAFMDGKIRDSEMSSWELHAYMSKKYQSHYPARNLFGTEYEELFAGFMK